MSKSNILVKRLQHIDLGDTIIGSGDNFVVGRSEDVIYFLAQGKGILIFGHLLGALPFTLYCKLNQLCGELTGQKRIPPACGTHLFGREVVYFRYTTTQHGLNSPRFQLREITDFELFLSYIDMLTELRRQQSVQTDSSVESLKLQCAIDDIVLTVCQNHAITFRYATSADTRVLVDAKGFAQWLQPQIEYFLTLPEGRRQEIFAHFNAGEDISLYAPAGKYATV